MLDGPACLPPGAGGDAASELRRQAVLVDDLRHRLDDVVLALPRPEHIEHWWGPAREALQTAIDLERARLRREADRLEGVRIQLEHAALLAAQDPVAAGAP
jgi:hypothetical protein